MFDPAYFDPGYFDPGYFGGVIDATPSNPETYGTEVEAVAALWDSTPALAALGPLYFVEAEEGTALPYFTQTLVGRDAAEAGTTARALNRSVVQISIHDRTPARCEAHARKVRRALHRAQLAIGSGSSGHCLRGNELVAKGEGKGPGASDCWMQMIDFDVLFFGSLDAE